MNTNLKTVVGKEFELYDISAPVAPQTIRHVVADNVEFVLKREKLLPRGYSVIIPMGGDDWDLAGDRLQYDGRFEVFAPDHDTIVAYGQVNGWGSGDELSDITLSITEVTGDVPEPRSAKKSTKPKRKRTTNSPMSIRGMRR